MTSHGATADYKPWFERWPELKEDEEKRFEKHELPWEEDLAFLPGYLTVHSLIEFRGSKQRITIIYPSEYPELPPAVNSEQIRLERHQLPFSGNFCLLEQPIDSWRPGREGAADLIADRLGKLLRDSETGIEIVKDGEAPMPEPATSFFQYEPGSVVLVPANLVEVNGDGGSIELAELSPGRFVLAAVNEEAAQGPLADLEIRGHLSGKWVRLEKYPPQGPGGEEVLDWVRANHSGLIRKPAPPGPPRKPNRERFDAPPLQIASFVFPEERDAEGNQRDSWLFLGVKTEGRKQEGGLTHAEEVTQAERKQRIRHLEGLEEKRVALIGLGSLGADVALHLARADIGTLDLVDFDRFEANNSVRHPLGISNAGLDKTAAMEKVCRDADPFCTVVAHHHLKLGEALPAPAEPLRRLEEQVLPEADLIVETTGLHQIQHLIGRLAWEEGIPMVSCFLTNGFLAGEVLCLEQGKTMCVTCFQRNYGAKEVIRGDAAPEDQAAVSAQGCSHPTVVGAGFDAAEVSAMASRLAAQVLLKADSYPRPAWDHAVVNFQKSDQDHFLSEELTPTLGCRQCGAAG